MTKPADVDAYIAQSQPFAQPILKQLRKLVHQACPEVEEALKWGMPHFLWKGNLAGMAAFKQHCAFYFWHGQLVLAGEPGLQASGDAMGQFGRITSLADLPDQATLLRLISKAIALNAQGVKKTKPARPKAAAELPVPADLAKALAANKAALKIFTAFTPGKRKEYIEWLAEAKTEATRERRTQTAVEWIAEGKSRNWKYQNC